MLVLKETAKIDILIISFQFPFREIASPRRTKRRTRARANCSASNAPKKVAPFPRFWTSSGQISAASRSPSATTRAGPISPSTACRQTPWKASNQGKMKFSSVLVPCVTMFCHVEKACFPKGMCVPNR